MFVTGIWAPFGQSEKKSSESASHLGVLTFDVTPFWHNKATDPIAAMPDRVFPRLRLTLELTPYESFSKPPRWFRIEQNRLTFAKMKQLMLGTNLFVHPGRFHLRQNHDQKTYVFAEVVPCFNMKRLSKY